MKALLKMIGESGFWRVAGRVHTTLYRWTGGRVGATSGQLSHLLLTTTGRKSGEPRTVPLTFLRDGNDIILVASNGGSDRHPSWWLNLEKTPDATVQLGRESISVTATRADAQEHARLWPLLEQYNPFYGRYREITDRRIPVVVLRPAKS